VDGLVDRVRPGTGDGGLYGDFWHLCGRCVWILTKTLNFLSHESRSLICHWSIATSPTNLAAERRASVDDLSLNISYILLLYNVSELNNTKSRYKRQSDYVSDRWWIETQRKPCWQLIGLHDIYTWQTLVLFFRRLLCPYLTPMTSQTGLINIAVLLKNSTMFVLWGLTARPTTSNCPVVCMLLMPPHEFVTYKMWWTNCGLYSECCGSTIIICPLTLYCW
jgi:hypothetical protein